MRVVSVAYTALVPDLPEPRGGGDAAHARWMPFGTSRAASPSTTTAILADAHDRIGAKLEYTCLATAFCPPEFTLGELRQVYETVWGVELDRPNFRRKVLTTPGFVEAVEGPPRLHRRPGETGRALPGGAGHRPASSTPATGRTAHA